MQMKPSPCTTCTRVADPGNCENKLCKPWRQWFICRWEQLRQAAGPAQDYLQTDPCESCLCPKDLCAVPCQTKTAWQEARQQFMG